MTKDSPIIADIQARLNSNEKRRWVLRADLALVLAELRAVQDAYQATLEKIAARSNPKAAHAPRSKCCPSRSCKENDNGPP